MTIAGDPVQDRRAAWARPRQRLTRTWRDAAGTAAPAGWQLHRGMLFREAPSGNIAILAQDATWFGDLPGLVVFGSISCSAIARAFGQGGRRSVALAPSHLQLRPIEVAITDDMGRAGERVSGSVTAGALVPVLDGKTARDWLHDHLHTIATWMDERLADDRLLVAFLERAEEAGFAELRYAAVLARLRGQEAIADELVRLSERALVDIKERGGWDDASTSSDRSHDPLLWTHRRFVRFFDALEATP